MTVETQITALLGATSDLLVAVDTTRLDLNRQVSAQIETINNQQGSLDILETLDKSSLVAAINELSRRLAVYEGSAPPVTTPGISYGADFSSTNNSLYVGVIL
jgi:hypothetical protein